MVAIKFLQINTNHSSGAQDLALQFIYERKIDFCCIAEPWSIPNNNTNWFSSKSNRAAIYCNNLEMRKKCKFVASLGDWVGIGVESILIVSCYMPSNDTMAKFKRTLKELKTLIRDNHDRVLLCGDFNARSVLWGCNTGERRGAVLDEWISEMNLIILNRGRVPTCVRPQGSSIVDLTIASAWTSDRVCDWRVEANMESLSDHLYYFL